MEDGATFMLSGHKRGMLDPVSSVGVYANPERMTSTTPSLRRQHPLLFCQRRIEEKQEQSLSLEHQMQPFLWQTDITIDEGANIDFSAAESKPSLLLQACI